MLDAYSIAFIASEVLPVFPSINLTGRIFTFGATPAIPSPFNEAATIPLICVP